MSKKPRPFVTGAIAAVLLIGGVIVWMRATHQRGESTDLEALRIRRGVLQEALGRLIEHDPILTFARDDSSGIAVALSETLLVTLVQDVAARYLDRIEIDLKTDIDGHGDGEYAMGTPFGKLAVGEWSIVVKVREMNALLAVLEPTVDVSDTNRIHLALPVEIRSGQGSINLDFAWDSKSVFNAICRDFKTTQAIEGRILPQRHLIRGDLVLSADERGIVAEPEFPPERFPLSMALEAASWDRLREALEKQDTFLRCGMMMNPDSVIGRLRDLGIKGLRFKLPRAMFRTMVLPASVVESVQIQEASVLLSVRPHELRIPPGLIWYSADIRARRAEGPPAPKTSRAAAE